MFEKKSLWTHTLTALAALSLSAGAFAGIYKDAEKTEAITPVDGNYRVEGNAYLEGHWGYGNEESGKTLEIEGDLLEVSAPSGTPKLDQYAVNAAVVKGNVDISILTAAGDFKVGGEMTLDELHVTGTLTDLDGKALSNRVTVRDYLGAKVADELTFGNLDAFGTVVVSGGTLNVLGGHMGSEADPLESLDAQSGGTANVAGDVWAKDVHAVTEADLLNIEGTLHLSGSNSHGAGTVKAIDVDVVNSGWHQIDGMTLRVARNMTVSGGTLGILPGTTLDVGNALTLRDGAFLQYQSTDKALELPKLVLQNDYAHQNAFQTYGADLEVGVLEVDGGGRIDVYGKNNPELSPKVSIGELKVSEDSEFAFSNTRNDYAEASKASVTVGAVTLAEGAKFANGIVKPGEANGLRGGVNAAVLSLTGASATIENLNGTMTIGSAEEGVVAFSGVILDEADGVSLTLNKASHWTVTDESRMASLSLTGGVTDLSQTEGNVTAAALNGTGGTVVVDVAKTNTFTVASADEATHVLVKASETADTVTLEEASGLLGRVEGVEKKTGFVDEGMYEGAIHVDAEGNAVRVKNNLMSDTLELTCAATLALNRMLTSDIRKRLGDVRSAGDAEGAWVRYEGARLRGEGTKSTFGTVQVGADAVLRTDLPVRIGAALSFTEGELDHTRGDADLDAYGLALYGTWLGEDGTFADAVARVAKSESDMTVDRVYTGKLENTVWSLSGEVGRRFEFVRGFYAEPQAEVTYAYVESDSMTLRDKGEGHAYRAQSVESLVGRVGVVAGISCPNAMGGLYLRASLLHEFLGDAVLGGGNGARLEKDGGDTWFGYGIGANVNVAKNAYVWADLERTAGASMEEDVRGTVGVRFGF